MQLTLRPYVTTGVALVGASVIALTPISQAPAVLSSPAALSSTVVSNAQVSLAAAYTPIDPFTRWVQVAQASSANIQEIVDRMMAKPLLQEALMAKLNYYVQQVVGGIPSTARTLYTWGTEVLPAGLEKGLRELMAGEPAAATQTITGAV